MLAQPDASGPRRDGLVLRLFFGRTLGPDACRARAVIAWADAALATMESERALFLR